jgi:hypothetical protein
MVNFIVHVPNQQPFFLKKVSTVGISQTSINVAGEIIKVIEELGPDKCVGVVTDNASNMQGAWKIIEDKFPKIHCNGCASHVMNLLIRDICESHFYKDVMASIQKVCLFVKCRQHILAKFNEHRKRFSIARSLKLTVPTRWSSHFVSVENLLSAKYALMELAKEEELLNEARKNNRVAVDSFVDLLNSDIFWTDAKKIRDILLHPTNLINVFERNDCDISKIYPRFQALILEFSTDSFLNGIALHRWNFIHTDSMAFSYLFTPKGAKARWFDDEYLQTKISFKAFVKKNFIDVETQLKCLAEVDSFLDEMNDPLLSPCLKEEYDGMPAKSYWIQYGRRTYPTLCEIIIRLFNIPTSSAAAERVWSIFDFIHTKKRNRLCMEKVDKLAYIYQNSALLDALDQKDYFEDIIESEDEIITIDDD